MIFYFSGTGNTRWAAELLAQHTNEELRFIPNEMKGECKYELKKGERLCFCFPVHGWQPPRIVRIFIRKAIFNIAPDTYTYALVTCGDSIGRTMEILNQELMPKGLKAVSVFSLVMPESYVCLPFMYTDTPKREKEKIEIATVQLQHYATLIDKKRANEVHTTRGLTPWLFSHVIGAYFNTYMITDSKFTVDPDCCIHCGKCQQVCPTNNIKIQEGIPEWLHEGTCTTCLACYHYCPKHAINYGKITKKRGQYYFGHKHK